MRRLAVLAVVAALAVTAHAPAPVSAASVEESIGVGGVWRTYVLHVPPTLPASTPVPLLLMLHGGGGTGRQMERLAGFSQLADRAGSIAVYPDGVGRSWNDGRGDPHITAQRERIDDVAFIAALIGALSQRYRIDSRRVYVTGISNGGFMAHGPAAGGAAVEPGRCDRAGRGGDGTERRGLAASGTAGLGARDERNGRPPGALWRGPGGPGQRRDDSDLGDRVEVGGGQSLRR